MSAYSSSRIIKNLLIVFQWAIPVLSFIFIWYIIDQKAGNDSFVATWKNAFNESILLLFFPFMFLLTSLNIGFESLKWKLSLNQQLSIFTAVEQTFLSFAAGFITPLRSGALLARIITNEKSGAMHVVNATLRMAVSQFTVTFFIGLTGLIGLFFHYELSYWAILVTIFTGSMAVIFSLVPFRSFTFFYKEFKIDGISFSRDLLMLSLLRYLVFASQFYFLLKFFGVKADWYFLSCLISVTYLVNSILPSGILGKLGIRELSGILIIGECTGYVIETSCAAFFIWIMNQALPAAIGSVLFLRRNFR